MFIPLQKQIVEAIRRPPGKYPYWSGESTPANCTSAWQEAYRKPFKHAGIAGHPHRFRHMFAKNLLVNEPTVISNRSPMSGRKKQTYFLAGGRSLHRFLTVHSEKVLF